MMGMLMTSFWGTGHLTKRLQLQLVLLIPTVQHFFSSKPANRPRLGWGSACSPPFSANVCALKFSALTCKPTHFSHTLVIKPVERRTFLLSLWLSGFKALYDTKGHCWRICMHFYIPHTPLFLAGVWLKGEWFKTITVHNLPQTCVVPLRYQKHLTQNGYFCQNWHPQNSWFTRNINHCTGSSDASWTQEIPSCLNRGWFCCWSQSWAPCWSCWARELVVGHWKVLHWNWKVETPNMVIFSVKISFHTIFLAISG